MRTIEGYIARQIARTSGVVLLIMAMAFVLERTLRLMRDVDPASLPLDLAAKLILWRMPEILGIAGPPAFFAGVLLIFQRLVRDGEFDAFLASGAGPASIVRPLAMLATGVAGLLALVLWFLLPYGRYEVSSLMAETTRAALTAPLKANSFIQIGSKVIYIEPRPSHGSGLANVFLHEPGIKGDTLVVTAVADGFEVSLDGGKVFFLARDGARLTIPGPGRRPALLTFSRLRQAIYTAGSSQIRARGAEAVELTLPELVAASRSGHPAVAAPAIRAQLHTKIARVTLVWLLPLTAIPLAIGLSRRRQWIAIVAGSALVLAIDQALIFGETVVSHGKVSPWLATWTPVGVFAAIALALVTWVGLGLSRAQIDRR